MRLNQVTLPSTDVARSIRFYKLIGLSQIVDSVPRYARFVCPDGDSTLSIHLVNDPPAQPGVIIYFECEDLDSRVEQLKANGIVFDTEPVDQDWLWREAYLRDPDGNVICLFHAGENRLDPPWRIG